MPRIVKSPEERRNELITAAQKLFYTKGYEKTTVSDIVKAVGVAQGTFYYHFGSKVGILEAMVRQMIDQQAEQSRPIVYNDTLSALEKFNLLVGQNNQWKIEHKDAVIQLARQLIRDDNVLLEKKMTDYRRQIYGDMLVDIIEEGVEDGIFQIDHARESADLILVISRHLGRSLLTLLLADDDRDTRRDTAHRQIETMNLTIASILGLESDFQLVDPTLIDEWFKDE